VDCEIKSKLLNGPVLVKLKSLRGAKKQADSHPALLANEIFFLAKKPLPNLFWVIIFPQHLPLEKN
jgi:hypothetical protein